MTFLQPWVLVALPLVALPLIIHLINQRRFQTVQWAAMMFLLSARALSRGYSRLRHWLIMALRMAAGAGLTVAVTLSAAHVGTAWSGLLTAFPVLTLVMATFSHRTQGADFVVALQRATVGGLYAFVAFCAMLAWVLERTGGIATSFVAAVAATVAVQWLTRRSAGARPAVAGTPPATR